MSQQTTAVIRSIRVVVVVQFDKGGPKIGELLQVQNESKALLLVDHLSENQTAICFNLFLDRSIQKNMIALPLGRGLEIPVGQTIVGRVLDATGRPLDGQPAPAGDK